MIYWRGINLLIHHQTRRRAQTRTRREHFPALALAGTMSGMIKSGCRPGQSSSRRITAVLSSTAECFIHFLNL
jgi:hypothetical protein